MRQLGGRTANPTIHLPDQFEAAWQSGEPGVASPALLKRFEYEAQVLARLQHSGIAHIYAIGTHEVDGQAMPYFVMEYIPNAKTLTQYAEEQKLSTHERLALFRKVCDAVAHGHQKGVINPRSP